MRSGERRLLLAASVLRLGFSGLARAHGNEGHPKQAGPVRKEKQDWGIDGDAQAENAKHAELMIKFRDMATSGWARARDPVGIIQRRRSGRSGKSWANRSGRASGPVGRVS